MSDLASENEKTSDVPAGETKRIQPRKLFHGGSPSKNEQGRTKGVLQESKSGSLLLEKPAAAIRLYAGAKQEQVRKQGSETGEALAALIEGGHIDALHMWCALHDTADLWLTFFAPHHGAH